MHKQTITTVLGFDFGTKKIGVAVGQTITQTASPLASISNKKEPDWLKIKNYIQQWSPQACIVGLPLDLGGQSQPVMEKATAFAHQLQEKFQIEVILTDERYSTKAAKEEIFERYGYQGLQKIDVDSVSAVLIIEQWLRVHALSS